MTSSRRPQAPDAAWLVECGLMLLLACCCCWLLLLLLVPCKPVLQRRDRLSVCGLCSLCSTATTWAADSVGGLLLSRSERTYSSCCMHDSALETRQQRPVLSVVSLPRTLSASPRSIAAESSYLRVVGYWWTRLTHHMMHHQLLTAVNANRLHVTSHSLTHRWCLGPQRSNYLTVDCGCVVS